MINTDGFLTCLNLAMMITLISIAVIDISTKIIHQKLLNILLLGSAAAIYLDDEKGMLTALTAMALMFGVLSLVYIASRKSIGWGDVKLCTCVAAYLGIEKMFSALVLSVLICGLCAAVLIIAGKSSKHSEIPFAPFLAAATIIVVLL